MIHAQSKAEFRTIVLETGAAFIGGCGLLAVLVLMVSLA